MQKYQKWIWFIGASLLLMVLLCFGWVISRGPAVHASGAFLTCTGNESIAYRPGITNVPQTVVGHANDTLGPCVAPAEAGLSGGSATFTVTIPHATCTSITHPIYTVTYHWNNGKQSMIEFTHTTTTKLATGETQVISMGRVVSGLGAGEQAQRTVTNLNVDLLACFTAQGLRSNAGPVILLIM